MTATTTSPSTPTMTPAAWFAALDDHYLDGFVRGGGATVKFAVCFPGVRPDRVAAELRARAEAAGYLTAHVDAAQTKIHMIEQVFGAIAAQLPWRRLSEAVLTDLARAEHWEVPPEPGPGGLAATLAAHNGLDEASVSIVMQRRISSHVFGDRELARDFRVAMTWLARARLAGGDDEARDEATIVGWMCGRTPLSALRPFQIFTRVQRSNARHLLGSTLSWIRRAGYPGLVVTIDGSRLFARERPADGSLNYTTAAVLDAYEVFRQFIDATDDLEGLLLAVLVPPEVLDLEPRGRGLGRYPALMYRVYDEVRDSTHPNPLIALIRLEEGAP
jgi:hypothetical protein